MFSISNGISESELANWLTDAAKKYDTFADGRINYHEAVEVAAVMCSVVCQGKLLILKRSNSVGDAQVLWSVVSGYLDAPKSVAAQAVQELLEETGIHVSESSITVQKSYRLTDTQTHQVFIIFPCLLELPDLPVITLDHEHTEYAWIDPNDLPHYQTLPSLGHAVHAALGTMN